MAGTSKKSRCEAPTWFFPLQKWAEAASAIFPCSNGGDTTTQWGPCSWPAALGWRETLRGDGSQALQSHKRYLRGTRQKVLGRSKWAAEATLSRQSAKYRYFASIRPFPKLRSSGFQDSRRPNIPGLSGTGDAEFLRHGGEIHRTLGNSAAGLRES